MSFTQGKLPAQATYTTAIIRFELIRSLSYFIKDTIYEDSGPTMW